MRTNAKLRPAQSRSLLSRLKRPDLPNLVEIVAADLATKESRGFDEFQIHRALLPEQLDELPDRPHLDPVGRAPAQQRQVVDHGLGQEAPRAVVGLGDTLYRAGR